MENIPKKVTIIEGSAMWSEGELLGYSYTINKEVLISIDFPRYRGGYVRKAKSDQIIDESKDFVNGFKVVQTANKEYAYVREKDNVLLPYRYDIATDFNEYGYAMVGKDAKVSWIDREFRYFDADEEKFLDEMESNHARFNGFLSISDFSKGETPLSRISRFYNNTDVSYLGIDGKYKEFFKCDGEKISESDSIKEFPEYSTIFDDEGHATANDCELILLSGGYYLSVKDLIRSAKIKDLMKIATKEGFLDIVIDNEKKFNQAYNKFLKYTSENTMSTLDKLLKNNEGETEYDMLRLESIGDISNFSSVRDKILWEYGIDVYKSVISNKKFAFLFKNGFRHSNLIDIELFQSLLAKNGIPSYIDYEEDVFHYNGNKHVKTKKIDINK